MSEKSGLFRRIVDHFTGQFQALDDESLAKVDLGKDLDAKSESDQKDPLLVLKKQAYDKDGYKRHDAVKKLSEEKNPDLLPIFYQRVNDWVPEIRATANSAIVDLITNDNAKHFIKYLPELYHLKKCSRSVHHNLIADIEKYLVQKENAIHLLEGLSSKNHLVSTACYKLVIEHKLADPGDIVLRALKNNSSSVRIKASHLIKDLEGDLRKEALAIAIQDRNVLVRREAFIESLKSWASEPLAKEKLFDSHHSIREIAVVHLGKSGADVQYTYLRHLNEDDPNLLRKAIWGIGFLKGKECIELIEPFKKSPFASVRFQAEKTLESLSKAPERFLDTVEWNSIDTQY